MGDCLSIFEKGVPISPPAIVDTIVQPLPHPIDENKTYESPAAWFVKTSKGTFAVFADSMSVPMTLEQWTEFKNLFNLQKLKQFVILANGTKHMVIFESSLNEYTMYALPLSNSAPLKLPIETLCMRFPVLKNGTQLIHGSDKTAHIFITDIHTGATQKLALKTSPGLLREPIVSVQVIGASKNGEKNLIVTKHVNTIPMGLFRITAIADGVAHAQAVDGGVTYAGNFASLNFGRVALVGVGDIRLVEVETGRMTRLSDETCLRSCWFNRDENTLIRLDRDSRPFKAVKYTLD